MEADRACAKPALAGCRPFMLIEKVRRSAGSLFDEAGVHSAMMNGWLLTGSQSWIIWEEGRLVRFFSQQLRGGGSQGFVAGRCKGDRL